MRMASLLLLVVAGPAVCLAAEPKEPLRFTDLVAVQQQLRDLDQFLDNQYIYDDKVDEFVKRLGELDGRHVSLPVRVEKVWDNQVMVTLPEVSVVLARDRKLPGIVVVPKRLEETQEAQSLKEPIINLWTPGNPATGFPNNTASRIPSAELSLPVAMVGLDLAKVLRQGNPLLIRGTARSIIVKFDNRGRYVAFLIRDPKVERGKAADDPEDHEDAR